MTLGNFNLMKFKLKNFECFSRVNYKVKKKGNNIHHNFSIEAIFEFLIEK